MRGLILPLLALPLLGGCIAQTAVDVVTLPVKVASKTVDVLTTSQSEADEKRGRRMRKHEQCVGEEQRRAQREHRQPDYSDCDRKYRVA